MSAPETAGGIRGVSSSITSRREEADGVIPALSSKSELEDRYTTRLLKTREAESRVRELLDIATDPCGPAENPIRWCRARMALGQLLDSQAEVILGTTVLHNLSTTKARLLLKFKAEWESAKPQLSP